MKEHELRKNATCAICGEKTLATGFPLFCTVTIKQYKIDDGAIRRQAGMEMMMGGSVQLAQAMGADETMAKQVDSKKIIVCFNCVTGKQINIAEQLAKGKI